MKGVFIYFKLIHYTASMYSQYVWQNLLPVIFAEPLTIEGNSVFKRIIDKRIEFFKQSQSFLTGECLKAELCFPQMKYSTRVRTFDPNIQRDIEDINLGDFDYIMIAAFNGYYEYINWLRKKFQNKPIILVQDDAIEEIQYSHCSLQSIVLDAMRYADGFISYQEEMTNFARAVCKNVLSVNHPMSPEFQPNPASTRQTNLICVGVSCWNYDFINLLTAVSVLYRLRQELNEKIEAEFLGMHDYQYSEYEPFLRREGVRLKGWSKYGEYYEDLKRYSVILNLNGRAVAGRVSAEAALVGTPVVGNELADMQKHCWPELSVNRYDAFRIYELCKKLLYNREFRISQIKTAEQQVNRLKKEYNQIGNRTKKFIVDLVNKKHPFK